MHKRDLELKHTKNNEDRAEKRNRRQKQKYVRRRRNLPRSRYKTGKARVGGNSWRPLLAKSFRVFPPWKRAIAPENPAVPIAQVPPTNWSCRRCHYANFTNQPSRLNGHLRFLEWIFHAACFLSTNKNFLYLLLRVFAFVCASQTFPFNLSRPLSARSIFCFGGVVTVPVLNDVEIWCIHHSKSSVYVLFSSGNYNIVV